MDQQRPTLSQSPLRMHTNNKHGNSNNFSQKQLGNNQNTRGVDFKGSPIRESLIKNTGAFILGNNSGGQGTSGGSPPGGPLVQQQSASQLPINYAGAPANPANADMNNLGTQKAYGRGGSLDRTEFDYGNRKGEKEMLRLNQSQEKDVLDNFMSLPKQQQMQIQMLTEQQQMAYITQHRAETSGVRLNQNQFNQVSFRGIPPSSGGTGAFNALHHGQQQSSQPILQTTNKYPQALNARQSQAPQFAGMGGNGDSGSFSLQRNAPGGGLSKEGSNKHHTQSSSPMKSSGGDVIKNKRVFIENTVDSILQSKSNKASNFMNKPVGAMSGTGTTDVHPKIHSVSPRDTLGQSIVGLPNIVVGSGQTTNITKQNARSNGVSPTKLTDKQAAESQAPQRAADLHRQVDDFLAETDKMTFL